MCCFFFNDTATTEIYTLSLHDALPISRPAIRTSLASLPRGGRVTGRYEGSNRYYCGRVLAALREAPGDGIPLRELGEGLRRSEEHTSELQSRQYLVCRLLLEKKKKLPI